MKIQTVFLNAALGLSSSVLFAYDVQCILGPAVVEGAATSKIHTKAAVDDTKEAAINNALEAAHDHFEREYRDQPPLACQCPPEMIPTGRIKCDISTIPNPLFTVASQFPLYGSGDDAYEKWLKEIYEACVTRKWNDSILVVGKHPYHRTPWEFCDSLQETRQYPFDGTVNTLARASGTAFGNCTLTCGEVIRR